MGGGGGGGGIHFPSANWNICTRKQQDTFPIPLHTTFLHEIKCEEKKTVEKGYKNTFYEDRKNVLRSKNSHKNVKQLKLISNDIHTP